MNDDELWVCLLDVDGAYVYGAGRAPSVLTLVAALTDALERRDLKLTAIEWLNAYDELPPQQRESEPIASLVEAAGDGVALSEPEPYEDGSEQKDRIPHVHRQLGRQRRRARRRLRARRLRLRRRDALRRQRSDAARLGLRR